MSLTILSVAFPFAPAGPDTAGGAEQILSMVEQGLQQRGHRSVVVACEGSSVADQLIATRTARGLLTEETRRKIRAEHRRNILHALKNFDVDLIHLHGLDFMDYLPPPGVPALITLHLPISWYEPTLFQTTRPGTWFNCVSHSQRRSCPDSPMMVGVVENGVPVSRLQPNGEKGSFGLALGRICPEKNFQAALEAAVVARMPLILAGEVFPYEAHQRHFHEEIQPRLSAMRQFIGPVGFVRKHELLVRARCLVVPSVCPETSSLVSMEALACGTPVVGFDSGAVPEIVEHGVTGFITRNTSEMAEAMLRSGSIEPARCREAAEKRFSAARMVDDYLALYNRILSASRPDGHVRGARFGSAPRQVQQRSCGSRFEADLITTTEGLVQLSSEWYQLWQADPNATPFQSPQWLIPWWRHVGVGELRAVAVHLRSPEGSTELAGLLPCYLWTDPANGCRKLFPLGIGTSDYLNGVFHPETAVECVNLAVRTLLAGEPDVEVYAPNLRPDSPLLDLVPPAGYHLARLPSEPSVVLDLPTSGRTLESILPRSLRQNLRYYRKRLEKEGFSEFAPVTPTNVEAMMNDLVRLHAARWSQKHAPGVLAADAVRQMHLDSAPRLLADGLVRMWTLRCNGRPAGVIYGLFDPRPQHCRFYYYIAGMDPNFARFSPGTLLIAHSLEQSLIEGCRAFDFLRGQECYKRLWGARPQPTWSLHLSPRS